MTTRPSLLAAFLTAILLSLPSGCSQHHKPAVLQPSPTAANTAAPVTSEPTSAEPVFNAPDALARKTAAYTQQMQAELNKNPDTTDVAPPQTESARADTKQPTTAPAGKSAPDAQPDVRSTAQRPALEPRSIDDSAKPAAAAIGSSPVSANVPTIDTSAAAGNSIGANSAAVVSRPEENQQAASEVASTPIGSAAELSQKLDRRVKEYPRDVSAHLDYQLLRFLLDDRVPDLAALSSLPTEDRELISSLMDGLINFRSAVRADNNMLLSRKVRPLVEMSDRLRGHADLTIPTIALCTSVRTFGEYEPIDPPKFAAGKNHDVILYCEVENFSSQLDEKQRWQTKLTQEAVLYTETGMPVWSDKAEQINDVSRHRRRDFFIVKKLRIPSSLAVGRYLMKLTIVDQQMSRVAEATIPIIVAVH